MTIKECYEAMQANYDDAKSRLMTDKLIDKFMLKFPQDETMQQLEDALQNEAYELSFRCAHTLKGVAANLGFTMLQNSASELTEALRAEKVAPDQALVSKVRDDYALTIETIRKYEDDKQ